MSKLNLVIFNDDELVINLCQNYWELNQDSKFSKTIKEVTAESGLGQKELLKLIGDECEAGSTEVFCQICKSPCTFKNRNDFLEKQRQLYWYSQNWLCNDCELKKELEEEKERQDKINEYRNLIQKKYSYVANEVNPEDLSLESAVYLLSLIRFCANEDITLAKPLNSETFHKNLSPKANFDYEILRKLFQEDIIKPHPDSPIDAFRGEEAETFYLDKVFWILPILPNTNHSKYLVMRLEEIFRLGVLPSEWLKDSLIIWKKIALNECLQYLDQSLREHNLTLTPGEKTILVINNLLEDYSVGQIFNMIWRASKDAAAFLVRMKVTKQHAANTVVGAMQRYGENAKIEGWEVKSYRRPYSCPQSILSQVFFDSVLKIGEAGFNLTPYIIDYRDISDINVIEDLQ